jgi:dTDP-4-dehydrorhamnose reductase
MTILISGKNGQLGKELQNISASNDTIQFVFLDKEELNIADEDAIINAFRKHSPSFFINCAAYTAVDKAESDQERAYLVNAEAVGNIAKACHQFKTRLIHVSTDYVFDGKGDRPYTENDVTNPINYYGYTKWLGEQLALNDNPDTIIIRTSWVYSTYGNNFVKTMLRLMQERKEINVVNDQFGSPTHARDLAEAIMQIVNHESMQEQNRSSKVNTTHHSRLITHTSQGIFHFSNDGIISWYDFAVAIRDIKQFDCIVNPIPTSSYPTPAKRPAYSGFNKAKIVNTFDIQLKKWRERLERCLQSL